MSLAFDGASYKFISPVQRGGRSSLSPSLSLSTKGRSDNKHGN